MDLFASLGGEDGVRRLVDRFYDEMDARPSARGVRAMHPADLAVARDKLTWFVIGWSGGPPRYTERFGHPRLRARHLPFAIGESERDQWLECMGVAIDACVADAATAAFLRESFAKLADHMRNATPRGPG